MSTLPDPDPKQTDRSSQVSQAEPTINEPTVQEIRSFDEAKLLEWIQQKLSVPLKPDDEEKFLNAEISGEVFLDSAGSEDFYTRPSIGLAFGASFQLAELAREVIGRKSKYSYLTQTASLLYHRGQRTSGDYGHQAPTL